MTISIYNIISANPIFTKILQHEFTGKQSFLIGRMLRALSIETEAFNDAREKIVKKYAEIDSNYKIIFKECNIKIKDGQMESLQKEINELLKTNLELNISPIPLNWLDELKLTPQEMIILEPFLLIEE